MQTENWVTIKQVLQELFNLTSFEREEFWAKSDLSAEIKNEVKSLLEFEEESEKFMSATAGNLTGELFFEKERRKPQIIGQQIGIYKIVGELGIGGMGAVYLAERTDGKFAQKVALKMLKREFNVEKIRRTFKRESEIQSKLNHRNIARLLDVGTTGDGIPYLVMEFVEGLPIDKFCEHNNLPLNARLKPFNKVCQAVAHAHRNLIVHRDLKPSNIIVTAKGEPKLLDFGISKLLGAEDSTGKTAITMLGAMTPEYASPEQIKGETVTTATDIYSLGVVLYKILTGTLPYNFDNKINGDILKTITENEPNAPSAVQISDSEFQITNLENPKSQIPNPKLFKGDIDNIILKSLRKEPEQRYATVEQFSADIWRFIDNLPVLARPATFSYRAKKFFKRNKISVIAAALIFVSLIGGIAVALWQAREARAQANLAIESQKKSDDEREKAEKISKFMFKVFGYANPAWYAEGAKFGGNTRVIEAMEELSDKIDIEFAGQADVQSELHHKFAESFGWTARYEKDQTRKEYFLKKARFHSLHGFELRKQFYGDRHELVAKDLYYNYMALGETDAEQAQILAKGIEMMRSTNPNNLNLPYMLQDYSARLIMPDTTQKHEAYRQAVTPPTNENKYQIAERYLREALPILRFHYKEDNYAIFTNECRLAYTLAVQENRKEFEEHFAVCKQGEENLKGGNLAEDMRKNVEIVEQALAEVKSK